MPNGPSKNVANFDETPFATLPQAFDGDDEWSHNHCSNLAARVMRSRARGDGNGLHKR